MRREHDDVVYALDARRTARLRRKMLRCTQATWRGLLVARRFGQLKGAAAIVQEWSRARAERVAFVEKRAAALWLQAAGRGMAGRR